jgi:hypothetical protein
MSLITFENVSFEDIRPYHEIEMYRQLLRLYLPIQKICLFQNNIKPHNIDMLQPFKGSFPKKDKIKDTYQTCETTLVDDKVHLKVRQIQFPISPDESFTFNHLIFPNCFYELCDTKQPIHIVYSQEYNIMFICFGTGERYLDIRSLDHAVTVENENQYVKRDTVNKGLFYEFLKMINSINISNIILCGHSNGMNSAIVTAFILQAIRMPDFCEKNHRIIGSWIDDITLWRNEFNTLKDKKICVVGTGGSPVLFINQTEFKNFYESLQGAFVHILSGILIDGRVYIDNFGSPLYDLRHYKYGIYYTNTYISDNDDYAQNVCFYKIIINSNYSVDPSSGWTVEPKLDSANRPVFKKHGIIQEYSSNGPTNRELLVGISDTNQFIKCYDDNHLAHLNNPSTLGEYCKFYLINIHVYNFYYHLLSLYVFGEFTLILNPHSNKIALDDEEKSMFKKSRKSRKKSKRVEKSKKKLTRVEKSKKKSKRVEKSKKKSKRVEKSKKK